MEKRLSRFALILISTMTVGLTSCSSYHYTPPRQYSSVTYHSPEVYAKRLPEMIETNGKKTILVDPNVHAWGAYNADGTLERAGIATAGDNWCADEGRPCKTTPGTFRIYSLGNEGCKSSKYPKPNGGGLMPYCMFFNKSMALHGSPDGAVIEGNVSHGCVRMRIQDAEWVRFNFANLGTRVVVVPYGNDDDNENNG